MNHQARDGILQLLQGLLSDGADGGQVSVACDGWEFTATLRRAGTVGGSGAELPDCLLDIIEVLNAEARRLTTDEVINALARHGKTWGDRTVRHYLAQGVRDGVLDNDPHARPHRGYGVARA